MRNSPLLLLLLFFSLSAIAENREVKSVRHAGPFSLKAPVVIDSLNNKQEKYSDDKLIDTPLSIDAAKKSATCDLGSLVLPKGSLNLVSFDVIASSYIKSAINVKGAKSKKVFVDGKEAAGEATLQPGQHSVSIKFIADSTGIGIDLSNDKLALCDIGGKRLFNMADNLGTKVVSASSLSASGRWAFVTYAWYDKENKRQQETMLCDLKTGQKREVEKSASWMPRTDRYYYTEKESGKTKLLVVNPEDGAITTLCDNLPSPYFDMSPTEDFLILTDYVDGPRKEDGVFEILHPDDRQPNWRSRSSISRMDLATGFVQPLLYTYHSVYANEISSDGKHLLLSISTDSLTQRPTTRSSYYDMSLETLEMKPLVEDDGFIAGACWAQGTDYVIFHGSTEAFNGIGNRVPAGLTPSMYDYHLYVLDTKTKKVTPVTADDKTSIESVQYSPADGNVYYTAQNGDSVSIYRLNLKTMKSFRVPQPLEVLTGFDIASKGGNIIVQGSSACEPYEVYNISSPATLRSEPSRYRNEMNSSDANRHRNEVNRSEAYRYRNEMYRSDAYRHRNVSLVLAPNSDLYADVKLGTVHPWKFTSSRGYDVTGFYFLPADFDASKKYPVIVHYYGGCSPTSRRFGGGSHYPAHYWNALGYITFIVNPSGASGFGQEWASRHVNTMGEGPAQDIIDATRQFAKDVPQVDADHIGCVSASYGGFMTQYMLTKDNPFACGISHAGISDHTSYWGEGYWGYSYSEVSAANSYPWTRKDLYVDRSPLYNADKINKPLLFTHGTADTNVPIGESIQMYTALRLLGKPTAFIQVEGENHGIMDPVKRTKWINSMVAWFDRYLKLDDSWWKAIYTDKKL